MSHKAYDRLQPVQTLQQWLQSERLPHAVLLVGSEGSGRAAFAEQAATILLCKNRQGVSACGSCSGCHWMKASSHPDYLVLKPEKEGGSIAVDIIRESNQYLNETASASGYKILVINPATAMNHAAANALLKTLEEPPAKVFIMLIADRSLRLSQTILSRCQRIVFPEVVRTPDAEQAESRKKLFEAIIPTNHKRGDLLKTAEGFADVSPLWVTDCWLSLVADMQRLHVIPDAVCHNADYQAEITAHALKISMQHLAEFAKFLLETRRILLASIALNKQLLMESYFIQWREYAAS